MTPMEREIERRLVNTIKRHNGLCLKWVCPGWTGVPDRIVLLPGGRIIFVELKRPKGGRFSKMQRWWAQKLIDLGFNYWVIDGSSKLELFEVAELEGLSAPCKDKDLESIKKGRGLKDAKLRR